MLHVACVCRPSFQGRMRHTEGLKEVHLLPGHSSGRGVLGRGLPPVAFVRVGLQRILAAL